MKNLVSIGLIAISTMLSSTLHAQLLDNSKVDYGGNINAPGSTIGKSLNEQIGAGQGDVTTPGSSIYLINRDPARSIRRGRQLFQRKFSLDEGLGPRVNAHSTGDITETRSLGAGLTDSCASCHGRPRGSAGFGGEVATRPDSRDAPHLFGLGLVEQLADEMTKELRSIRSQAIEEASNCDRNDRRRRRGDNCGRRGIVTLPLVTKGISFGTIRAFPNGNVDTSGVEGVDTDLRVRPFFHQGGTVSMREFIIGGFKDEMGLQTYDPILCAVTDPENPRTMTSPSGFVYDPSEDQYERPPSCDEFDDPDNDGVENEIDAALIDHLEFYLLNYFKPGRYEVTQRAEEGRELMDRVGCTSCHTPNLIVDQDRRVADVETNFDPVRGIFNQLYATATTRFDVVDDGDPYPLLVPQGQSFEVENFFSDLKRHDLGPAFHEREYDGTLVTEFVTEPLWGVGTTAPYGHDGRSINLDQVIKRHGGEAQFSSRAYVNLSSNDQRKIQEFLQTLVLFPPDDTASNLNPGNPGTNNPQDPSEHGTINLGALFQIPEEGGE